MVASDLTGDEMNPVDIRATPRELWYKYGVAFLLFEMALAIALLAMTILFRAKYQSGSSN